MECGPSAPQHPAQLLSDGKRKSMVATSKAVLLATLAAVAAAGKQAKKLSDKMRDEPPATGTTITYKYQEKTRDGEPRLPVFVRVRPSE